MIDRSSPLLIALSLLLALATDLPAGARSTEVSAVVVAAGPPPLIVASYPADGAVASAGVLVLKIVFSQAMTPDAWSYGRAGDAPFPNCLDQPRLLADQRTFVLLCTVAPGSHYAIQINPDPVFANANGRSAKPVVLHFSTDVDVTRDMHHALLQAGLTDADEPLMAWRDPGLGVSRSPER